jgi:hypothetical protein
MRWAHSCLMLMNRIMKSSICASQPKYHSLLKKMMLLCRHSIVWHIQLGDESIQNVIEYGIIDWQIDDAVLDDQCFFN